MIDGFRRKLQQQRQYLLLQEGGEKKQKLYIYIALDQFKGVGISDDFAVESRCCTRHLGWTCAAAEAFEKGSQIENLIDEM